MKVFVTGASGFIGSHVLRVLLHAGHSVLGLVSPRNNRDRIRDISSQFELLVGDLNDSESIQRGLKAWAPQVCIHLAWYSEPGKYLHARENLDSLRGSVDLLRVLFESGCSHFIGAGTCAEYDVKNYLLCEGDSVNPETLYAAAKLSFKLIGEQIARQYDKLFSWGRVFYLYGPYEDDRRLIPSAIKAIRKNREFPTTEGRQVRDYLHVEDVAHAFVKMAESSTAGIYNVSSGVPVTIRELLERLVRTMHGRPELLGFGKIPYPSWNPMHICGNNQALRALGWEPGYDFDNGLMQTVNWWLAHKEAGW
jgi:nucleoside-diphosphate-sugar epimerase